jgi:hypothetical protein
MLQHLLVAVRLWMIALSTSTIGCVREPTDETTRSVRANMRKLSHGDPQVRLDAREALAKRR